MIPSQKYIPYTCYVLGFGKSLTLHPRWPSQPNGHAIIESLFYMDSSFVSTVKEAGWHEKETLQGISKKKMEKMETEYPVYLFSPGKKKKERRCPPWRIKKYVLQRSLFVWWCTEREYPEKTCCKKIFHLGYMCAKKHMTKFLFWACFTLRSVRAWPYDDGPLSAQGWEGNLSNEGPYVRLPLALLKFLNRPWQEVGRKKMGGILTRFITPLLSRRGGKWGKGVANSGKKRGNSHS